MAKYRGRRKDGKHPTHMDGAHELVHFLKNLEAVSRVSKSYIKGKGGTSGGHRRIRIVTMQSGVLAVQFHRGTFTQTFLVHASDHPEVRRRIAKRFGAVVQV